jgi:hypothetical protein
VTWINMFAEARDLAAAAPELGRHVAAFLLNKVDRLDVVGAVEFVHAVDMTRMRVQEIQPIVGHRTGPQAVDGVIAN